MKQLGVRVLISLLAITAPVIAQEERLYGFDFINAGGGGSTDGSGGEVVWSSGESPAGGSAITGQRRLWLTSKDSLSVYNQGSGSVTVHVVGVDHNYKRKEATVTVTTADTTHLAGYWMRINKAWCSEGSINTNDIRIQTQAAVGGGDSTTVLAVATDYAGETNGAFYSTPRNERATISSVRISHILNDTISTHRTVGVVGMYKRGYWPRVTPWRKIQEVGFSPNVSSVSFIEDPIEMQIGEDLEVRAAVTGSITFLTVTGKIKRR